MTVKANDAGVGSTVMAKTGLRVNTAGNIKVSKSVVESGLVYDGTDTEAVHVSDATADIARGGAPSVGTRAMGTAECAALQR